MKTIYENFGCLRIEAEDGRDAAWLGQMAENLHSEISPILDNYFTFENDDGQQVTIPEAKDSTVLKAVEINVFGVYVAPFDLGYLRDAYLAKKEDTKKWVKGMAEKKRKGDPLCRQDAIDWWNENFPKEPIK